MGLRSNHLPVKLIFSFFSFKKKKIERLEYGMGMFKTVHNSSFGVQNGENMMKKILKTFQYLLPILPYHFSFP